MNRLRRALRWFWAGLLVATGASWSAKRRLRKQRAIIVLAFHRVLDDTDFHRTHSLTGILVGRRTFEQLAAYVVRRFEVVDLSRIRPGHESNRVRIAFTFDDGWLDNHTAAFPIARAFGIPMTIFVCPGLLERSMPFWPERVAASIRAARPSAREEEIEAAINRLKPCTSQSREEVMAALPGRGTNQFGADGPDQTLSWAQIAEMDRAGVIFGAHTQTHQVLTSVPESTARQEIRESKAAIEHALNKRCDLFAYPNGDHSRQTRRLLAEAGFTLAFTTKRGAWTTACDPLAIPRPNISDDDVVGPMGRFSPAMFAYTVFWKAVRASPASGDLP